MIVSIEGAAINEDTNIQASRTTDSAGGRADTLEIQLADSMLKETWALCRGMTVEIQHGDYSTGDMYLTEIDRMRDGKLALRAVSLPDRAKDKYWNCFEYVTLRELLAAGAEALEMRAETYGIDGNTKLRRAVQRNQTWPEFLAQVFRREGATIKFDGKTIIAVDYQWAFSQPPARVMAVEEKPRTIERPKFRTMRVCAGVIEGKATDAAVTGSMHKDIYDEQVYDSAQAIRAAKGLLLEANLEGEIYKKTIALDTGLAAMSRIDLFGHPGLTGNWFAHSVTHDFTGKTTELTLKRCITTIR